ncbi:MAG: hypothetical protein IT305_15505 [Chloroflexi bacterium]|nr:hypothetical protein [Chloroflexota bacterium]
MGQIFTVFSTNAALTVLGVILVAIGLVAWYLSNRAEATPSEEQRADLIDFLEGHFARYVARGLAAEGVTPDRVAVSNDPIWRKVFLQHVSLQGNLYACRRDIALALFVARIDPAVRQQLVVLAASEQPAALSTATP